MSTYPKQLIHELSEHLDPAITKFYMNTCDDYDYPVDSISSLIEYTMESSFGGLSSKSELSKIYTSQKHNRRRMRLRWFQTMENDLRNLSPDDKHYPFQSLYIKSKTLKKTEWNTLFGNITFDDLVKKLYKEADLWRQNINSLLIDFPALDSFPTKKIFSALQSDTLISIYNFIDEEYDGSIEDYFMSFPKQLINIPIFSVGQNTLDTIPAKDNSLTNRYDYEGGTLITNIQTEGQNPGDFNIGNQLSSLNQLDLLILSQSIQNLDIDFFTTRQSRIKKSTLVKLIYKNGNPSKKHYIAMNEHCLRMSKYNFTIICGDNKNGISFNLLDSVDTRDPEYIIFTYGEMLYKNIINNKLTNIKSSHLRILEQPLSNILMHPLYNERVILSLQLAGKDTNTTVDICKNYPYSFFNSNVRFKKRRKKTNMDEVEEVLKEFVKKGIIISSYERLKSKDEFRIHFYPLTEEEIEDLSYERFSLPEDIILKNDLPTDE